MSHENFNTLDNREEIFDMIDSFNINGKNFTKLSEEIILYLRNLLIDNLSNNNNDENNKIIRYIEAFSEIISLIKNNTNQKMIFEINVVKLMIPNVETISQSTEKNIQINETKKKIKIEEYNKQEKKEEITTDIYENIKKLKEVRVNNTLSDFNKKILLNYKEKLENVNKYIIDPDYSEVAGLILDGELKAASTNNLIFVFKSDNIAFNFNMKIIEIEKLLFKIGIENVKVIATDIDDWNIIKEKYNSKTQEYKYIDDKDFVNLIFSKQKEKVEKNSIESVFDDIIEYDK